jgi:type I restriction-modification system DNA methylase subunit
MLKNALEKIHFNRENGLVFCDHPKFEYIGELYHIREKAGKLGADAILFRRKYENNEITDSKPAVYIFKKENFSNTQAHKELHAKIWSAGDIEVYFIVSKTRIDIFNARKPAEVKNGKDLLVENLCLASEALKKFNDQRFSAWVFGKGLFWEQENFSNQFSEEDTPFHRLLEYLMAVRKDLHQGQKGLPPETTDKLLIICLLVKFLEEIKDDNGKHTLRRIYKKYQVENFAEVLLNGKCMSVLNELAGEFNGTVFDTFGDKEKKQIEKAKLKPVADFLKAKLDIAKKQYFLWEQYSFNHLPIELISSIYENFLQKQGRTKQKGVVYTPPLLVSFLVDEVMPLDKAKEYFSENKFSVLDPSCGSGVFLVAAYKRMLQWYSINHYEKTQEIKFPDQYICQRILEDNIFGADIHKTAVLITVFSLTIALLDKLKPKEIWNDLKLKNLHNNIRTQDFFEWAAAAKAEHKKFDLVIGNPPFNDEQGKSAHKIEPELVSKIGFKHKKVAGNKFALQFFEAGMALGKKVFLILPSNVLLYNKNAQTYREQIFKDFTIEKIFDFTHLRRELFGSADTPVCAVLANPAESSGTAIEHTVIKRIISCEKKIAFEIDHYDRHWVRHDWATDETKQFVWKTNLLGGGRLFHLIYRLSLLPTLKGFIVSKNNWKETRGFEGGKKLAVKNQDRIIGITENGEPLIQRNIDIYSDKLKDQFVYEPPFMIIDQVLGENSLPACFISKDNNFTKKSKLYYNRDFIGISVPKKDETALKNVYDFIRGRKAQNQLNSQLFAVCISSNCLILHETAIRKGDILSLPYCPDNEEYLQLSQTEKILQDDVLEYCIHLGKAIGKRGEGRKLHKKVSKEQLEKFGKIFCDVLNPIYAKSGKSWQCGNAYQTQLFTIFQLGYGTNNGLFFQMINNKLDDVIKSLIYNRSSNQGAVFTRICRNYKHLDGYDCVFLIKPNAIRYWLNSVALRDADETFMDLKKAGR